MRALLFSLALSLGLSLSACPQPKFQGTDIADNAENREILDLVSEYQQAMEDRDLDRLLAIASPGYHEDRGTLDQSDDYGIQELRSNPYEFISDRARDASLKYGVRSVSLLASKS